MYVRRASPLRTLHLPVVPHCLCSYLLALQRILLLGIGSHLDELECHCDGSVYGKDEFQIDAEFRQRQEEITYISVSVAYTVVMGLN
jgi:hypothetical protein